ncbi:hypothetical protein ACPEH7_15480 [Stenotrophomonas sp. NPDC101269]|uniref:hypothetical protein n=1 Tax=Stenotrophomonas TaxID=40323 RepID=UPI001290A612|nr:hypothetical protein [Stenotrophomonas nematodicola]
MTRSLLDATVTPPPLPAEVPPLSPLPVERAPAVSVAPDALAGALPGWDLLPATGFVRRKRATAG